MRDGNSTPKKAAAKGSAEAGLSTDASQKCPCSWAGCKARVHVALPEKGSARHLGKPEATGLYPVTSGACAAFKWFSGKIHNLLHRTISIIPYLTKAVHRLLGSWFHLPPLSF